MYTKRRPSWDSYSMESARLLEKNSTCVRRQVGAVFVKDGRIPATGYNGASKPHPQCLDIGCLREQKNVPSVERHELCRDSHGEQNAIIQAAKSGVNIEEAVLYCTHHPCSLCVKMIMNASIHTVYYLDGYPDKARRILLKRGN